MISILMPIYNGIEFIDDSVSSILNQTYDKWELLIGINGHPENSDVFKIAKEYEKKSDKIRVFDFYTIKGKNDTLNTLVNHCKYNYVALLDVDDIWHEVKLEMQSPYLNNYDVIGSKCVWFGDREGVVPPIPTGDISNYNFTIMNPIINSSSIIRKKYCCWDYEGIEDYDLWLKLWLANKKIYNCEHILVKHRIHNTSFFNAKGNGNLVEDLLKSHYLHQNMTQDEVNTTKEKKIYKMSKKYKFNQNK